ncbi:hypothetical protein XCR1_1600031 [Xenorhabdus cabanillasii JM26]|uniref:Uncharacterized protein n=1 Tax=Xenorhabdus cabanillasii JM26 TaxID=1427517 RepID=W1IX44_9GAMM|nr:hypothetical protein XCR1_1600031 [Xenorhabdus cabanillasii JM26]
MTFIFTTVNTQSWKDLRDLPANFYAHSGHNYTGREHTLVNIRT